MQLINVILVAAELKNSLVAAWAEKHVSPTPTKVMSLYLYISELLVTNSKGRV